MSYAWLRSKQDRAVIFPSPSPLAKQELKRVLQLSGLSFGRFWNPGTGGNFSVRDKGGLAWVSVSGKHKGSLTLTDFLAVHISDSKPCPFTYQKPSDETALHCAIYRHDPTARAVFHVHTPYTVALVGQRFELAENEMLKVFGFKTHEHSVSIPCIENTQDMEALGKTVADVLDKQLKLLVLAGHGVYAWGSNADEAMYRIEALEYLCQLHFIRRSTLFPSE